MTIPFVEVIESITPDPNILMWKFEDAGKEIKNGAALTVREIPHVMLLNEGKSADIFSLGHHKLSMEMEEHIQKFAAEQGGNIDNDINF